MKCYVFDIDGTLADCSHRQHLIKQHPADWRAFFAACGEDLPIQPVIDLALVLSDEYEIVFVSGRSDECRAITEKWLIARNLYGSSAPYMRKAGDFRPDHEVKSELMDQILADGWELVMIFDDRDQVVKMWRARGFVCAQVAEGNF